MYSVVTMDGKVLSEHFTRDAAYLSLLDALDHHIACKIEMTCGQPSELVKACRQTRGAHAYARATAQDIRRKPEPMKITRFGHTYVVAPEMLKSSGELKKNALDAINRYFASLAKKEVATT